MIPLKKTAIKRRTLLRGMVRGSTVLLGLPLLEAMFDGKKSAQAQALLQPRRFVSWFFGNGVNLDKFEPDAPGSSSWTLPPLLEGLSDLKDYLTICTGLQNRAEDQITHHEGLTAFSGYSFKLRPDLLGFASDFGGPTIDQVIAERIAAAADPPLIDSLQIQISKFLSTADTGMTASVLSVKGTPGALLPRPGVSNPRELFRLIFGVSPAPEGIRSSMLDFLRYDLGQLRRRLGSADQVRMEAHLEGIRALELQAAASQVNCGSLTEPTEENLGTNGEEPLTLVNSLMADLVATAFACDLTRVASVLFVGLAGDSTFGVDMPETNGMTHHMWSHNRTGFGHSGAAVDGLTGYEQNVRFIMNRYGDWMRALRSRLEPDGVTNLLDTTILYATSDCANGNHMINRQPLLIGGHGRGHLKSPGIHFQAAAPNPGPLNELSQPAAGNISDVLLTCLRAFDPAATSFGDLSRPTAPGSTQPQCEIESGVLTCT